MSQRPTFFASISDNLSANWFDHSRDLLYMVNNFRERMIRPIFGVGHSMGAAQLFADHSAPVVI